MIVFQLPAIIAITVMLTLVLTFKKERTVKSVNDGMNVGEHGNNNWDMFTIKG